MLPAELLILLRSNSSLMEEWNFAEDKHKHFCFKSFRYCIDIYSSKIMIWTPSKTGKTSILTVDEFLSEDTTDKDAISLKEFIIFNINLFSA
jgi:hypothetical protein